MGEFGFAAHNLDLGLHLRVYKYDECKYDNKYVKLIEKAGWLIAQRSTIAELLD